MILSLDFIKDNWEKVHWHEQLVTGKLKSVMYIKRVVAFYFYNIFLSFWCRLIIIYNIHKLYFVTMNNLTQLYMTIKNYGVIKIFKCNYFVIILKCF